MKITVTRNDIDNGEPMNPYRCAIAKAVSRAFKSYDVHVTTCTITVNNKVYNTPKNAKEFIAVFDAGYKPNAFTFNIGRKKAKKSKKVSGAKLVTVKVGKAQQVLTY